MISIRLKFIFVASICLPGCGMVIESEKNASETEVQGETISYPKFKGFRHVQAFGNAVNAPSGTPTARQASVTWAEFTNASSETKYRMLRTLTGTSFDLTTAVTCTSSTNTTCIVCNVQGAGSQSCTDTQEGAAPATYDYVVAVLNSSNSVVVPSESLESIKVKVSIPPDNMVLVQRESVNSEICELMGKSGDPLNHGRCAYDGIGAVPYNTSPGKAALNLAAGYYDFGYNLFIDRWEAACNWTTQASGGLCGVGATAGDCFGNAAPAAGIGSLGQVYYRLQSGICYVKTGAGWLNSNSSTLSSVGNIAMRANIYSNDPGTTLRPPLAYLFASRAQETCGQQTDANYGAKRLLRLREFVAAAAWSYRTDDIGYQPEAAIGSLESGADHATAKSCNTQAHLGVSATASFLTSGNEISRDSSSNGFSSWLRADTFRIGSQATKGCISRVGAQDLIGNAFEQVSDETNSCGAGTTCVGVTSPLDSGNSDLVGYSFDGLMGPGPTVNSGKFGLGSFGTTHVAIPLALPFVTGASSAVVAISDPVLSVQLRGDNFALWNGGALRRLGFVVGGSFGSGTASAGRFYWESITATGGNEDSNFGFRCALPAE